MSNLDLHPKMIGRENELKQLEVYLDKAAKEEGYTIFISGEAGIGKTRLVNELKQIAQSRGFQILSGNSMYESLTPFMPMMEALGSGGLEHLFAEEAPRVEAVYLVTLGGVLIKEVMRQETKLSPVLFTSMLTVVGNFISETLSSLSDEKKEGKLNTLGYENYRILIETGKSANLVVLLIGRENEFLIKDIREIKLNVEKEYKNVLKDWDGDEKGVKGIENILSPLINSGKYDGIYYGKDDPKIRRNLLFENVSLGLTRYAQTTPTLLCIEDLQWIDPSSLALIHYIARNTKEYGLLILGTYRPEDVARIDGNGHPLIKTMQLLGQENLFNRIELQRLPENKITEFISVMLGETDFSDELSNRIYRETEGNPLFLIQLMKLLVEEEIIIKDNGSWKLKKDLEETNIPSKIYNVILRRLNRIEKENRKILDYASVIGEIFTPKVLADTLDLENIQLVRQLEYMEQVHKLIHPYNGHYKFDHAKIKEVLYNEIPQELRMEYHSIIANSIEMLNKEELEDVIGDLAFHYYHCKKKDKALHYLRRAAEKAKREYSNEETIKFYKQALEFEEDYKKRMKIFENLGAIYSLVGDNIWAIESYKNALKLAEDKKKKAEIKAKIGTVYGHKAEYYEAIRIYIEALELIECQEDEVEAFTLENFGLAQFRIGEYTKALEYLRNSLKIRERIDNQNDIATSLANIGMVYQWMGKLDKALEHYEKSVEINEKNGDQMGIAYSNNNIGMIYSDLREYDKALEHQYKALETAERIGHVRIIASSLHNIGDVNLKMGECNKALEYLGKSLKICERIGHQGLTANNCLYIAEAHLKKGNLKAALDLNNRAFLLVKEHDEKDLIAFSRRINGMIYAEQKKWKESIESFKESVRINEEIGEMFDAARSSYDFGLMLKKKGDLEMARTHLNKAYTIYKKMKLEKAMDEVMVALRDLKT